MTNQSEPTTIEEYLKRVLGDLNGISFHEAADIKQELRRHLEALIESFEVTGLSHDDAVSLALQKFGSPQAIGRMLEGQWKREANKQRWSKWLRPGRICAIGIGLCSNLLIPKSILLHAVIQNSWQASMLLGAQLGFSMAWLCAGVVWDNEYPSSLWTTTADLLRYSPTDLEQAYNERLAYRANPNSRKDMLESFERLRYPLRALNLGFFARNLCWLAAASVLPPNIWRTDALVMIVSIFTVKVTLAFIWHGKLTLQMAR